MVIEYKLQNQSSFAYTCSKKSHAAELDGIDAHRCLSRLLTRSLTCYKAQYVRNVYGRGDYDLALSVPGTLFGLILPIDFMGCDMQSTAFRRSGITHA